MNRVLLEDRWRRRSCFGLILALFLSVHANAKPLLFDGLEYIEVNGSKHCLLIRCRDLANPLLLYLHGGPGESLIPFAHVATSLLTDRFTVSNLEAAVRFNAEVLDFMGSIAGGDQQLPGA